MQTNHIDTSRLKVFLFYALDLIILAIPVQVVLSRCFTSQLDGILAHGYLGMTISQVIHVMSQNSVLLWTLLGMILVYREAFKKQKRGIGIVIPLAVVLAALLSVIEEATSQIGSDSVAEATRTQWTQVKNYSLQFLQTSNLNIKYLVVSCAPFLFLLVIFFLVKARIYRPNATIVGLSCIFTLGALICFLYYDVSGYLGRRTSFSMYQRNMQDGTRTELSHFTRELPAPTVFVYIGEATNRDSLYSELKERLKDPALSNNSVLFSDVVSPHSHTMPSLVRVLSVSIDPERDQLTDDRKLSRANLVSVLRQNGIATFWISNKPSYEWVAALFGHEANEMYIQSEHSADSLASLPTKDSDVLPLALDKLKMYRPEGKVIFFHSQAGHDNYCDNIPETAVSRIPDLATTLPFAAVYGDVPVRSKQRLLHDVNCYRNAMAYVADNLERTMRQMLLVNSPVVLIYFSDHGEDALDGTGHDSSKPSFRKIEVPLMVFFNAAAKRAYESKFKAAVANKDKRFGTTWLSDSIVDIAGVSYDQRPTLSIFGPLDHIPVRYSSLRSYGGKQYVIAIDSDANSRNIVNTTNIDLYAKKQLIRSLPLEQQGRICVYRADSLLKYSDASRVFSCSEVDLVIDPQEQEVYVYHPPKKNTGLTLGTLLDLQPKQSTGFWLDVKNAQRSTLEYLVKYLNQRIPPDKRSSTLVEVALSEAENNNLRETLSKIREDGYGLSYFLPTDMGVKCSDNPEKTECAEMKKSIERILRSTPYSSLSLDIRARKFVASIDMPAGVAMDILDLSVKAEKDIDRDMLQRVNKYVIPYESPFNY